MVDLSVTIGEMVLANPVMPGSGTFAQNMARAIDLNRLGAIVTKTITNDLREGVPPPRVAEFRDATLFSIGIPSKGPQHYVDSLVPFYRAYSPPLIASISANTVEDFARLAARISVTGVAAIEANVSCPNLEKDGKAFGMDPDATHRTIRAMKEATHLPIWCKLTPNVGSIAEIACAAEAGGADALVAGNAILAMAIDVDSFQPRVANLTGGLTGPATRPIMLRMAYQCAQAVSIPVIGCGGIGSANDAIEYLLAGATAVQVGTANFLSPNTMLTMIDDLASFCEKRGISRLSELIGAMRPHAAIEFTQSLAW
jgi:dihydroorotate dehydrogenase (NAD+) catalytic subunit